MCFCLLNTNPLSKFDEISRHNFEKCSIKKAKNDDFKSFYDVVCIIMYYRSKFFVYIFNAKYQLLALKCILFVLI